ncbi:DUF2561 family protein [Mycobacterium kyorinense]|uniref:DUF2561 domain-containing protein n=1 Tax=Mycobacterium kyorinense TaxID=487514 RepID=A0A1X1YML2_9MYCO|nr:DUF2561 family protein [Mycobacterium kyorinense]ORW12273.1 hypothetical protein AWC14_00165 [Mycobacterium kyorinense]
MADRYSTGPRGWSTVSPTTGDRILIGVCAAIWLVLVGVSVAAVVALADLGRGFHEGTGSPHSSAVLYVIIVVSTLVILAAIPVLLRARRTTRPDAGARSVVVPARAAGGQPLRPGHPPSRSAIQQAPTERLTTLRPRLSDAAVDRIWLRGGLSLMAAMGVALIAVATATYLMAVGHQGAAWSAYVIAGIVTVAMPVIPWQHVRRLRRTLAQH